MIRKSIFIFFSFICVSQLHAQFYVSPMAERLHSVDFTKGRINLSHSTFSSPAAILSWYHYFHLLHFTDPVLYEKVENNLKDRNLFGTRMDNSFSWSSAFDSSSSLIYTLEFRHHICQSSFFTKDAFTLFLDGNSFLEAKEAELSPLYYRSEHTQKLNFGVMKLWGKDKKTYGLGLSFSAFNLSSLNELRVNRGTFFTAADGDSLNVDLDFELFRIPPVPSLRLQAFALDLNLFWSDDNTKLFFNVSDMGFLKSKKASYMGIDTSISVTAYDPFNPQQNNNVFRALSVMDSLAGTITETNDVTYAVFLAPQFYFSARHKKEDNLVGLQTSLLFNRYFRSPRMIASLLLTPRRQVSIMPGFIYDEYRKAGLFFEVEIDMKKHLLRLGSLHLENPLLYRANGQSWYVSYAYLFR